MKTLIPSVQEPTGDLQAVEETPTDPGPLLTAPDTVLWLGFGFSVLVFFLVLVLITRSRVIKPARAKQQQQSKTFFEPAGEDAEITFEEPEEDPQPTPKKKGWFGRGKKDKKKKEKEVEPFEFPDEGEAEAISEEAEVEVDLPASADEASKDDPSFVTEPATAEPTPVKKNRSPFAGLFSKKKKEPKEPVEDALDFSDPEPAEGEATIVIEKPDAPLKSALTGLDEEESPQDEPASVMGLAEESEDFRRRAKEEADRRRMAEEEAEAARRRAEEEVAAARRLAETEAATARLEAEQRLRAEELARAEAARDSAAEIHKQESMLEQRFSELSRQLEEKLEADAQHLAAAPVTASASYNRHEDKSLQDYLAGKFDEMHRTFQRSIDAVNTRIDTLDASPEGVGALSKQIASLNQLLSENATGATASKVQLSDLIRSVLPPNAYAFHKKLANNKTADCVIELPHPPGEMAIDAQFPVEVFDEYVLARKASGGEDKAESDFRRAILRHIVGVSERLIIPGDTAASALMFVPSETIYAELHARFPDLVQDSYNAHVWMVSPTSLMATLHTIREVMRNAPAPGQAEIDAAPHEVEELRERVALLEKMIREKQNQPQAIEPMGDFEARLSSQSLATSTPTFREQPVGAVSFDTNGGGEGFANERSLSREEEAFERLEREEALREAQETSGSTKPRPPFPLR